MGYQKAKHGGYKPEHRIEAASALVDLRNLHIVIPYGSEVLPYRSCEREKETHAARGASHLPSDVHSGHG
jgi:hypothetical protein